MCGGIGVGVVLVPYQGTHTNDTNFNLLCRIPYYSPIKLMFLLWLQLPRFSGAYRLTSKFLRPFLHQYYPKIDEIVQSVCHAFSRPEIVAVTDAIQEVFARLPVLEWFMRQPDGRPWRPPSSSSSSFSSVLPGGGGGL